MSTETIEKIGAELFCLHARVAEIGPGGREVGAGKQCVLEITWLADADTLATLSVAGKRAQASVELFGTAVP